MEMEEMIGYLDGLEKSLDREYKRTLAFSRAPVDEILYIAEMLWSLDVITIGRFHEIETKFHTSRSVAYSQYKK